MYEWNGRRSPEVEAEEVPPFQERGFADGNHHRLHGDYRGHCRDRDGLGRRLFPGRFDDGAYRMHQHLFGVQGTGGPDGPRVALAGRVFPDCAPRDVLLERGTARACGRDVYESSLND